MNGMRTLGGSLLALALVLGLSANVHAAVINFDTLLNGAIVTNQFPEATFSSNVGFEIEVTAQNLGSSLPNFVCTAVVGGSIDCVHDVFVAFTSPVQNLTFLGTGVNNVGVVALVDVYVGGAFASTLNVVGAGTPFVPVSVSAIAFSNVTSIVIHDVTDAAGIGWDDFTFETSAAVPEPATLFLLGSGLLGLAARRRRGA